MGAKLPQTVHKKPQRTCVACRQSAEKRDLVRFVRDDAGRVSLDEGGRTAGRGAYVCAETACFDKARKNRALERALRTTINDEDGGRIALEFSNVMKHKLVEEQ